MKNTQEEISIEKRIAMLIRKYDISDKIDNVVLGVFIGIISGVKIEVFMNSENSNSKWLLVGCCAVSVIFLIVAICINSSFVSRCLDLAKSPPYREGRVIKKDVANSCSLQWGFWLCLFLSFSIFGYGIYKFKSVDSDITTQIICPYDTENIEITTSTNE